MASSVARIVRFAERFIPDALAVDQRTHRRARLVVFFTAALIFWGPVFAMVLELLGAPSLAAEVMAIATLIAFAPLVLKKTASIPIATAMVVGPLYVLLALVALKTGGASSPALIWCLPPPLLALTLSGRRWGLFWLGVSTVQVGVFGVFWQTLGLQMLSPAGMQVLDTSCHVAVSSFLLSLAWTYESTQRTLDEKLDGVHVSLARANVETEEGNRELRLILDNVHQGLLTVELDGTISGARSAATDALFGPPAPGVRLWEYLAIIDDSAAQWLELGWDSLSDGMLPLELALDQLPKKARVGPRHLALEYRAISTDAGVDRVLVVVSDTTDAVERHRAERDQHELSVVVGKLLGDRAGFAEFFAEGAGLVARLASGPTDEKQREARDLHTLKGNAASFGATSVAEICHELEGNLRDSGETLSDADRSRLSSAWVGLARRLRAFGWRGQGHSVEIDERDLEAAAAAVSHGASREQIVEILKSFAYEPGEVRFARMGDQAKSLARRLDKGEIAIEIEDDGIRFDPTLWASLWVSFVHAVRNAVDHGLESQDERDQAGKKGAGTLRFASTMSGGRLIVELSDDGRGIDWTEVEKRARAAGLDTSSQAALESAVFSDGLTTRDAVTEVSGRGIGLASLRDACRALGGELSIRSERGVGTTLRCDLPPVGVRRAQPFEAMKRTPSRERMYYGSASPSR